MVNRGEIWWADLPEPVAAEPGYRRPVIIIQSNAFNRSRIDTVIAVALTTNVHLSEAPGNVRLSVRKTGLPRESVANVSQIITFDRQLLREKVGKLDGDSLHEVEEGIRLILSL